MKRNPEERPSRKGCLWFLKTGCLGIVGLFLLFVAAGTAWFFYMTREVTVHDEDLVYVPTPVQEGENGYFILQPVLQNITSNNVDLSVFKITNGIPSEEGVSAIPSFNKEHPEYLEALYAAAQYRYYQIPFDENIPLHERPFHTLLPLYNLSCCSLVYIESLIRAGNHEEALKRLGANMELGQIIRVKADGLAWGLIGRQISEDAYEFLIHHLSQGTFYGKDRQTIQSVWSGFNRNGDDLQMVRAEYSEKKSAIAAANAKIETNIPPRIPARLFRYVYNQSLTLKQVEQYFHAMAGSFSNPDINEPAIEKRTRDEVLRLLLTGNVVGDAAYLMCVPNIVGSGMAVLNQKAEAGLIGLYLALWKYYEEYGALPTDLNPLISAYPPEQFRDPFGDGVPFKYDPQAKEIFSIGAERYGKKAQLKIPLRFVD